MAKTYIALDLETTGLDAQRDAIIEVAVVRFNDSEILNEWSTLVNPGFEVSYRVSQLTGITNEELRDAPPLGQVLRPLLRRIGDGPIVGHSIGFDLGFLRAAGLSLNQPAYDTLELAGILLPNHSGFSLSDLSEHFGLDLGDKAHRALDDARASAQLLLTMKALAAELPASTLLEIARLAAGSSWPLADIFQEAASRSARQTFAKAAEPSPAERYQPRERADAPAEAWPVLKPRPEPEPVDVDTVAALLGPDGPLAARFPGYEHRSQQIEMLRAVTSGFNEGRHLMVEAGTGTGKSLAYLVPAIFYAVRNQQRVVISTNTINLQDQLFEKDIPDLQQLLAEAGIDPRKAELQQSGSPGSLGSEDGRLRERAPFYAALLKGRANYLCPRKLELMRKRRDLSTAELRVLAKILVWLPQTRSGDVNELYLSSGLERAIWAQLATDSETCTTQRCLHEMEDRCFYYQARRRAEGAHILVVNHALLLADVAADNRVLPEYRHLIIDEAHHLEEAATKQLSFSIERTSALDLMNHIRPGAGERAGLLTALLAATVGLIPPEEQSVLQRIVAKVETEAGQARQGLGEFFDVVQDFLEQHVSGLSPARASGKGYGSYSQSIRLVDGLRRQPAWDAVELAWENTALHLKRVVEDLEKLHNALTDLYAQHGEDTLEGLMIDVAVSATASSEMYTQLQALVVEPHPNGIYWAEIEPRQGRMSLHAAPLHVGPLIEQNVLRHKDTVVFTSATLRTAESFDYVKERLGAEYVETHAVGSPFDYASSTLVYVPVDVPEPNAPNYRSVVEQTVYYVALAARGRTLVLFTSIAHLREAAEQLGPRLQTEGIEVLEQGGGSSRRRLLESFKSTERAVLFGTRSFWEGVDIVGDALSVLVIVRLPFAVPSDPIFAARSETFPNPFMDYSVPDAILRFRQGFGRLIRSASDRGVCVILDRRVVSKRYGELFLKSLPECTVRQAPLPELPRTVARWLARDGAPKPRLEHSQPK